MERGHSPATRLAFALERLDATAALLDTLDEQIHRAEAELRQPSPQTAAAPTALQRLNDLNEWHILRRRLSNTYAKQAYEALVSCLDAGQGPHASAVRGGGPMGFWFQPPSLGTGLREDEVRIEAARQRVLEALQAAQAPAASSPACPSSSDSQDAAQELAWQLPDRLRRYAETIRAVLTGLQKAP
ncbi:hypothetical protein [Kitasatospora sp. GAS204B]|uniref:hypothetical protein n=1 Tax=unclassified Kitasatospora TaxID=2633591 RepID=UPI002475A0C6|nr:hypothetical protein [Kitasatospora sp. GAS204B]MDH6119816.1 hypothetical protein [Kitasatospora sp. GAS204B]